jgi:hypothetical protein
MRHSQLIKNIRQSDGADTSNMLDKMWNFDLSSQEDQFRDDLREATGIGRKGKGKGKRVSHLPYPPLCAADATFRAERQAQSFHIKSK